MLQVSRLFVLLFLLHCAQAQATPVASEIAVARQHFEAGKAHQQRREWALAAERYRQALAIKDTPGLRYRVGFCEEQRGNLVEAELEYARAAELLAAGVRAEDVRALLPEAMAAVKRRTPELVLKLERPVPELTLRIDGREVAPTLIGQQIPLNPGQHSINMSAPGYQNFQHQLELAEGDRRRIVARLLPESSAASGLMAVTAETTVAEASSPGPARLAVIIGGSTLAAAGAGAGIGYLLRKNSEEDQIRALNEQIAEMPGADGRSCSEPSSAIERPCADLKQALDDRKQAIYIATGSFIAAGVGAAAVLTALMWPAQETRVGAWWQKEGTGLSVSGRF